MPGWLASGRGCAVDASDGTSPNADDPVTCVVAFRRAGWAVCGWRRGRVDRCRTVSYFQLVDVVVFGSHAEGTATDDSDLDVAVVLRDVVDAWTEARAADDILWRHTLESGITVSALVIDAVEWETSSRALAVTARASGRSVA